MSVKPSRVISTFLGSLLLSLVGCRTLDNEASSVREAGLQVGGLRGSKAIETAIRDRVYSVANPAFYLGKYVGDYSTDGLMSLMGGYNANLGSSSLQNVDPNAVNMMLWRIAAAGAGKDIGQMACAMAPASPEQAAVYLNVHFFAASKALCLSPNPTPEQRIKLLQNLWLAVMRYDAPKSEMDAWITEMAKPGGVLDGPVPMTVVASLMESILMNPYFLMIH